MKTAFCLLLACTLFFSLNALATFYVREDKDTYLWDTFIVSSILKLWESQGHAFPVPTCTWIYFISSAIHTDSEVFLQCCPSHWINTLLTLKIPLHHFHIFVSDYDWYTFGSRGCASSVRKWTGRGHEFDLLEFSQTIPLPLASVFFSPSPL